MSLNPNKTPFDSSIETFCLLAGFESDNLVEFPSEHSKWITQDQLRDYQVCTAIMILLQLSEKELLTELIRDQQKVLGYLILCGVIYDDNNSFH